MSITKSIFSLLIALSFLNLHLIFVRSTVFGGYRRNNNIQFHSSCSLLNHLHTNERLLCLIRGGAKSSNLESDDDDDENDDEEDLELENKSNLGNGEDNVDNENDDDEEEEEDVVESTKEVSFDAPLASSAMKSATKTKERMSTNKMESVKRAVNSKLLDNIDKSTTTTATKKKVVVEITKKKKKKSSIIRLPYIIRAFMNPFTVIAMTKAYWSSLFDLNYLKNHIEPTQELRSALEEKAKKKGGSGGNVGPRKKVMKRGQSKSLSDLPQLSS